MENRVAPFLDAPRIAGRLARAFESGDFRRLSSAMGWAAAQLRHGGAASSLETERRELLLSIVESFDGWSLGSARKTRKDRLEVCYALLCQVRGGGDSCCGLRLGVGAP